jgi:uncharacterized integral membrane protein (TIGR00697 family)
MREANKGPRMQNYKFLNQIVLWNVFFAIICIPTAGKLIDIVGVPLSISIYYFPFVYILADILTEVYGYAIARRVLWYCIFAQLLVIAICEFVILYPPSAVMTNNRSYVDVLSAAPRLVLFGTLAMFAGDIANNYVLAKMKVWTGGRYISARFVASTLCGQMVNTTVFYICSATCSTYPESNVASSNRCPLLAKPGNRLQQLCSFSLTTNVYNKSGNLLFAQS